MKRDGFTIIEVIIFLAISSLMLTIAIIGSGGMARQARFSDSVNAFHSFFLQQSEEVINGVNSRGASDGCTANTDPGSDSCALIGKIIYWQPNGNVTVWQVRAPITPSGTPPTSIYSELQAIRSNVTLASSSEVTYELSWGADIKESSRSTGPIAAEPRKTASTRALINAVAILRSPSVAQSAIYHLYSPGSSQPQLQTALRTALNNPILTAQTASGPVTSAVCVRNNTDWSTNSPVAAITFSGAIGSAGIDSNFNPLVGATGIC